MKASHYDREGFLLDESGKRVVRDGEFVRVTMMFSDSKRVVTQPNNGHPPVMHRPGFVNVTVSDADREQRLKMAVRYEDRLVNAWKDPDPMPVVDQEQHAQLSPQLQPQRQQTSADAAYDRMVTRLEEAWRNPDA